MIIGIGVDTVDIDRIEKKINGEHGFREQVFSKNEISYCDKQSIPSQHYAARFAAKEAFLKASGEGLTLGFALSEIEIIHGENGKPLLILHGKFQKHAENKGWTSFHLSLSH